MLTFIYISSVSIISDFLKREYINRNVLISLLVIDALGVWIMIYILGWGEIIIKR